MLFRQEKLSYGHYETPVRNDINFQMEEVGQLTKFTLSAFELGHTNHAY
jgi:hypothetical protein